MLTIFLLFLVFVAVFTLALRGMVRMMGAIAGKYISQRHMAVEQILNTGRAPQEWTQALQTRVAQAANNHAGERRLRRAKAKAKKETVAKLQSLANYFKRSPCVDSEETRQILLNDLLELMTRWRQSAWEDILPVENQLDAEEPVELT